MNIGTLTRPIVAASFTLFATIPVKWELLAPVDYPGQTTQQSPDYYPTSVHGHHVGLLCKHVHGFAALGDDWDGYGAVPPSAEAIGNVMDLLNALPGEWAMQLHQDDLTPSPYGTITLEWAREQDYVSVEVGDTSWAFTAEIGGELRSNPNETYPNELLRQRVEEALAILYPDAVPHDAPSYTA